MLIPHLLLPLAPLAPAPLDGSLLGAVPGDAYMLVHCRDVSAVRARAERNDWYRLLGSSQGEPLLTGLAHEFQRGTHSDMDELLEMAAALEGEAVFFDTGSVAGFVTDPPAGREALVELVGEWLPGERAARQTHQIAGGAVHLAAWPDDIDGWSGRAGHFAAFVDHPRALAIYSGLDAETVLTAAALGMEGLEGDRRAPLVASYIEKGGARSVGVEMFVDFTPLVDRAEEVLRRAVDGFLPDPTDLLGLEQGCWFHGTAEVFPGTQIDCRGRLHLPAETLTAQLADTFKALPHTLTADLPRGIWGLYALHWDFKEFYRLARAAYEAAGRGEGLQLVDTGIEVARGAANVDPIDEVLNQLAGDFVLYAVEPPGGAASDRIPDMLELSMMGFHMGLVDGQVFLDALEKLMEVGGLTSFLDLQDIGGVDVYMFGDDEIDGGIAFLPKAFAGAPTRRVLERGLRALQREEGASMLDGSRMQAVIDENAGACFLASAELTPMRSFVLPELEGELRLPPLEEGQPDRDPFDSMIVLSARRTRDGFTFRVHTR